MPVYIHQDDALRKLTALEGERWLDRQREEIDSPYGFYLYLHEYLVRHRRPEAERELEENTLLRVDGGTGEIYGQDGNDRFVVQSDGELLLLGHRASQEKREQAEALGFRLSW